MSRDENLEPVTFLDKIKKHIMCFREFYLWPIAMSMFLVGAIKLIFFLTGTEPVYDPGILLDYVFKFIALIFCAWFITCVENHMYYDLTRDEFKRATFPEKCLDIIKTIVVFAIAVWFMK